MTRKVEKINELLKEVVAGIILREVHFFDEAMVTVTRVVTSPDLHYANVFVTIFSSDREDGKAAFSILKKSAPEIQRAINRKLRMRPVPRIAFLIDEEERRRERVEELLAKDRRGS